MPIPRLLQEKKAWYMLLSGKARMAESFIFACSTKLSDSLLLVSTVRGTVVSQQ